VVTTRRQDHLCHRGVLGDRVDGGAQIAIINPDGTGFRELTSGSGNSAFPSFSPDGHSFVYRAFEKDGYGLRIMDLETKGVTALTDAYDNFPLWSPRGDLIMFARLVDDAYEIHTITGWRVDRIRQFQNGFQG
jgi:TolB protein